MTFFMIKKMLTMYKFISYVHFSSYFFLFIVKYLPTNIDANKFQSYSYVYFVIKVTKFEEETTKLH